MRTIACVLLGICAAFAAASCASVGGGGSAGGERDDGVARSSAGHDSASRGARDLAETPVDFGARLLEIAAEYKTYTKRGELPYWAPTMCAAPVRTAPDAAIFSESKDDTTHGRKLYFLYARDNAAYERGGTQAVGQALVKESFAPEEVAERDAMSSKSTQHGDKFYKPGARRELFIMYRLGATENGTHDGWVYGTVSADGKVVTSQGRVESCMACHKDAPADHLFGPKGAAHKEK